MARAGMGGDGRGKASFSIWCFYLGNPEPQFLNSLSWSQRTHHLQLHCSGTRPVSLGHCTQALSGCLQGVLGSLSLVGAASFTLESLWRDKGGSQPGVSKMDQGPNVAGLDRCFLLNHSCAKGAHDSPPAPAGSKSRPYTSPGFWKLDAPLARGGDGSRKTVGWILLVPVCVPPPGWQRLWGEVSDPSWQDTGNRKQGGQPGGVLIPLPALSVRAAGQGEASVAEASSPSASPLPEPEPEPGRRRVSGGPGVEAAGHQLWWGVGSYRSFS